MLTELYIKAKHKPYWCRILPSTPMIMSITPDLALDEGYTYAGGLGVLEGDKFYGAAKLGLSYKVMTILYQEGYVEYDFDQEGRPIPRPQPQPSRFLEKLTHDCSLTITLRGEDVKVEVYKQRLGSAEAVFFRPSEPRWASELANRIYIWENEEDKFYTSLLLARSSAEYIDKFVGKDKLEYIDLQEAYTCLLPLLLRNLNYRLIIHTPGPWGHPAFAKELFEKELGYKFINPIVSLTELGLAASKEAFVVSEKHRRIMSEVVPQFLEKLRHVTNGIHLERWMEPELKRAYESDGLDTDRFISIKGSIRKRLVELIRKYKDVELGERMALAWCRRLVPYKRPDFVLEAISSMPSKDVFFILGGKAHPQDKVGLEYMKAFYKVHTERENVVYIPNYDVSIAKEVFRSVDLLLFTPFSGWEACGTSYMKAGVNGVPTLSSYDGGALELIEDCMNGWLFGEPLDHLEPLFSPKAEELNKADLKDFLDRLSNIVRLYKEEPDRYYKVCVNTVKSFVPKVRIERVLREYYGKSVE